MYCLSVGCVLIQSRLDISLVKFRFYSLFNFSPFFSGQESPPLPAKVGVSVKKCWNIALFLPFFFFPFLSFLCECEFECEFELEYKHRHMFSHHTLLCSTTKNLIGLQNRFLLYCFFLEPHKIIRDE